MFQLDILVNNAGRSQRALWEKIDLKVDKEVFDLNVFSIISLSRVVLKYFLEKGRGHFAVTSSTAGIIGVPFSASYTGSKHALHVSRNSYKIIFLKNKFQKFNLTKNTITKFINHCHGNGL